MATSVTTLHKDFGFFRVAAAIPRLKVADVSYNLKEIEKCIREAAKEKIGLLVFPELSLTGYTLGDLFHQRTMHIEALGGLAAIREISGKFPFLIAVGLPLAIHGKLFNVAALLLGGKILGIVPKTYLPGYKEFYEERWFSSGFDLTAREIALFGKPVPIGRDLLFRSARDPRLIVGVEICEDLWTPIPPSSLQALHGATAILNLSASNELVGKAEYRRELVSQQSARTATAYVYVSNGVHESTTDVVFSGHALIAENGALLQESKRFSREAEIIYADLDLERLLHDRSKMTSFFEGLREIDGKNFRVLDFDLRPRAFASFRRHVSTSPFVPGDQEKRNKVSEEIINIQAAGLVKRLEYAGRKNIMLGLSGGLDSTLALLVARKAVALLGLPPSHIHAFTMPGFGTTNRTKSNAKALGRAMGITLKEIDIRAGSRKQFEDIGHDGKSQDITFENVQARYRTMILMNKSNLEGGLVLGTGDLSEIALGWNTFTGDHISHYNVNAGVPKTLVRYLVQWMRDTESSKPVKRILTDILNTPVSPELLQNEGEAVIQKTEELVGPYELHDFFLYHFIRWGETPEKIAFLAGHAFGEKYSHATIKKWLGVFITRFFGNQWKRSVMPDGPKVGSVALSPRGDWRMPSDAEAAAWLKSLNMYE